MSHSPARISSLEDAINACDRAIAAAPQKIKPNIPTPRDALDGGTRWHDFEWQVWAIGEGIRRWLVAHPRMRREPRLIERLIAVMTTGTLRRGRQSFFMCIGAAAKAHAKVVADCLDDDDVCGHAASALLRMKVLEFSEQMDPLLIHRHRHIRRTAERYIARCRKS
jgi:hypothetical protein